MVIQRLPEHIRWLPHNYGVVSSFDVTVKGLINGTQLPTDNSNLNCLATTKRLNMIVDLQPAILNSIEVTNIDNTDGNLLLNYTLFPDNNYLIEIREEGLPGFVVIDTINRSLNPTSYNIRNLNTRDKYYNVSITAFDPCDGERRQSNIGSSIRLVVNAENRQNSILWEATSSDFQQYRVVKDGAVVSVINIQNQKQYVDTQVVCGGEYTYQTILRENGGFGSISGTLGITAISTDVPDAITDISASVEGSSISLTWPAPTTFLADSYLISRSLNGVNYEVIDTLTTEVYLDENLLTQSNSYYYEVSYFDACGNLSDESLVAQSILLTASPDQTINWSAYTGWSNGVMEYILEKYDENGQLIQQIPMGTAASYQEIADNPYQFIQYRVTAVPANASLSQVYSNVIDVIYRSKVAFPNAFSPNDDGENDVFNFKSRYITEVIMKIYNRWGELVFQTTDVDRGWDGNINGKPAPLGTYIHYTQLTDDMGVTFIKSGEVVLIR
ncbi:MAG: gliding motility-associated C-terminal domain-containing protein [Cyclobacteriaceae bacterium]|nr:gliding motility-associated C-terminal domain-containing protein [Cyclobacteriaceae bacterium]